jgi:hypothetical protein
VLRRLPLPARRAFRLALAAALATFVVYAAAVPNGYLVIIITLVLVSVPGPPPGLKAAAALVAIIGVTMLYGMLLGPVLTHVPVAGVLLALVGVAAATMLSFRPGGAIISLLVTMSSTVIAVVAAHSSAAAAQIVKVLAMSFVGAIIAGQLVHAVFPEDAAPRPAPPAAPPSPPAARAWIALRSSIIMLPPLIAALTDPASYIMLLIKGSQLSQQACEVSARRAASVLVGSTAMGGAVALSLWWLLELWPGLTMLTLGVTLAVLLLARPMYGVVASRFPPDWWSNAMVTAMILFGPAVGDTGTGADIQRKMLIRFATFIALALYATLAVRLLDIWRLRGPAGTAGAGSAAAP